MNESFEPIQNICPQCGKTVDTDARFCKYCAFDLANTDDNQNTSTEINQTHTENRTPSNILGVVVLLIILIVGAVISFNTFFNAKKDTQSVAENVNSASPTSASTLTLSEKGKQIEEKILRNESLTTSDLEGFSPTELRILRNVHFARYGRKYDKGGLGGYFNTRSWYKPNDDYNDRILTTTDKDNVGLILSLEQSSNSQTNTASIVDNSAASVPQPTPASSLKELSREMILSLVSNQRENDIIVEMSNGSLSVEQNNQYKRMIEAKIISCKWNPDVNWSRSNSKGRYEFCKPDINGSLLTSTINIAGFWKLKLIIGYKSPSEVSGISKIDENTAYAEVIYSFNPSEGYNIYEKGGDVFGQYTSHDPPNLNPVRHRILLRLYDDGWRVERQLQ